MKRLPRKPGAAAGEFQQKGRIALRLLRRTTALCALAGCERCRELLAYLPGSTASRRAA
jgi:LSD1 subclass zinc finger protein